MFNYLVTSKARRALLSVLWSTEEKGSVSELARLAKTNYRSAHQELNRMRSLGLVECERVGNATVFSAANRCPNADLMRALVNLETKNLEPREKAARSDHEQVRAWLEHYGAPLYARTELATLPRCEEVFVKAAVLARLDPTVAKSLPVFVWKNREELRGSDLLITANRAGQKRTVGFFLELTGVMSNDDALVRASEAFRDRRWRKVVAFFLRRQSRFSSELATLRTPAVARKWKFRMNMSWETFCSTFRKHTSDEVL